MNIYYISIQIPISKYQQNHCLGGLLFPTFITVISLVTSVADAGSHHADAMSSTVDVNALVGRDVTLSAFPPTVALAAATGVVAIPTAQDWAGS